MHGTTDPPPPGGGKRAALMVFFQRQTLACFVTFYFLENATRILWAPCVCNRKFRNEDFAKDGGHKLHMLEKRIGNYEAPCSSQVFIAKQK